MNKNMSLIILAVCGLMLFGVSAAQAGGSAFAGLSLPTGDFGDFADMGFHAGAALTAPVAPTISIGAMGSYHILGASFGDGSFNMFEGLAFGKFSSPTGMFGMVGLGMYSMGFSEGDVDRESDMAMAFGGGYTLTKLEITGLYHILSGEDDSANFISISAGISF